MTNATSYRDTNEIAKKIEDLNNETVKETLQERLDKVSKLLDDNKFNLLKEFAEKQIDITINKPLEYTVWHREL